MRVNRLHAAMSFLLLAAAAVYATGSGEPDVAGETAAGNQESELTVTDALGRTVSFSDPPERILLAGKAVLFTTNTAYVFPAAKDLIIGTGSTDQGLGDFYPFLDPLHETKLRFANNLGPEQVASALPDVVVLKSYLKSGLGDGIEELGIPVVYVDLETPDAFYRDVSMFGALIGDEKRADTVIGYYRDRVETVTQSIDGTARPNVLLVSYVESDGETVFNVPPAHWLQTMLVETAGGNPVWIETGGGTGGGWRKVNIEQIAVWDPDLVFVVSYRKALPELLTKLRSENSLGTTNARILPFPADYYSWDQPDPRWILGLMWMAKAIHPGLFTDLDMQKETIAFYHEMYRLDEAVVQSAILPRLMPSFSALE